MNHTTIKEGIMSSDSVKIDAPMKNIVLDNLKDIKDQLTIKLLEKGIVRQVLYGPDTIYIEVSFPKNFMFFDIIIRGKFIEDKLTASPLSHNSTRTCIIPKYDLDEYIVPKPLLDAKKPNPIETKIEKIQSNLDDIKKQTHIATIEPKPVTIDLYIYGKISVTNGKQVGYAVSSYMLYINDQLIFKYVVHIGITDIITAWYLSLLLALLDIKKRYKDKKLVINLMFNNILLEHYINNYGKMNRRADSTMTKLLDLSMDILKDYEYTCMKADDKVKLLRDKCKEVAYEHEPTPKFITDYLDHHDIYIPQSFKELIDGNN